ncbi:hypothetical protein DFP72DRAFT_1132139 [Ephemerocybe angulata]|uniref:Uncharacterized protein n=1 Tax=Ephemerocybe angulata TaxID=980116 RepID=A0A8H6HUW7_9AGAR|nr:hypothetical protein DFP72DRAFT_1132139 [Tulosesus angulatus]
MVNMFKTIILSSIVISPAFSAPISAVGSDVEPVASRREVSEGQANGQSLRRRETGDRAEAIAMRRRSIEAIELATRKRLSRRGTESSAQSDLTARQIINELSKRVLVNDALNKANRR